MQIEISKVVYQVIPFLAKHFSKVFVEPIISSFADKVFIPRMELSNKGLKCVSLDVKLACILGFLLVSRVVKNWLVLGKKADEGLFISLRHTKEHMNNICNVQADFYSRQRKSLVSMRRAWISMCTNDSVGTLANIFDLSTENNGKI